MRNRDKVLLLFKPDSAGMSEWIAVEQFDEAGLKWTRNGNLRRGVPWGVNEFIWEPKREAETTTSRIIALRTVGFSHNKAFSQAIKNEIKVAVQASTICNLSMMPIPSIDRNVDHRFGHKNHPTYIARYDIRNQQIADFQLIHRSLNLIKREMCKKCVETSERPAHPEIGFVEGDMQLAGDEPCRGCYLAEPERYR